MLCQYFLSHYLSGMHVESLLNTLWNLLITNSLLDYRNFTHYSTYFFTSITIYIHPQISSWFSFIYTWQCLISTFSNFLCFILCIFSSHHFIVLKPFLFSNPFRLYYYFSDEYLSQTLFYFLSLSLFLNVF